ncbi:MAG: AIR synthase-related protein, partial [Acidimicrobiales bacterium]
AHRRLVDLVAGVVDETLAGGEGLCTGVHDVSAGGLGVTLAEMAVRSGAGLVVESVFDGHRELFCELPSRVVAATDRPGELVDRAAAAGVEASVLGRAGGGRLVVPGLVDLGVEEMEEAQAGALPRALGEVLAR